MRDFQNEIDIIQEWLADTTEPINDWSFDGNELIILSDDHLERYTMQELKKFINKLKQ